MQWFHSLQILLLLLEWFGKTSLKLAEAIFSVWWVTSWTSSPISLWVFQQESCLQRLVTRKPHSSALVWDSLEFSYSSSQVWVRDWQASTSISWELSYPDSLFVCSTLWWTLCSTCLVAEATVVISSTSLEVLWTLSQAHSLQCLLVHSSELLRQAHRWQTSILCSI